MLALPFETTLVMGIALVSLALALGFLEFLLVNRVRRLVQRFRHRPVKHISISQNVLRFLLIVLWMACSAAVLFLAAFVQSFQNFTKMELVAEVSCTPVQDESEVMLLELTPVISGRKQETTGFLLHGDQWALEGNILKWDEWLNFAGLHTTYKLTRVRGRYTNVHDEVTKPPSVYSLVEEEEDPRWRWLYKYGYKLRFLDAVYGNTVYTYPSEKSTYEVFVTTSGFSVKVAGK
ncbi:MAG: hypothetical protein E2O78_09910 [Caldithrix sp.]|nr:MAG: hypothetical protein E2O78_09910 [Caldithrix sp.]